jgi:hypothetical protein
MGSSGAVHRDEVPRKQTGQQPVSRGVPRQRAAGGVLGLQRSVGNAAVTWLLRSPDLAGTAAAGNAPLRIAMGPFPSLETTAQVGRALAYLAADTRQQVAGYDPADHDRVACDQWAEEAETWAGTLSQQPDGPVTADLKRRIDVLVKERGTVLRSVDNRRDDRVARDKATLRAEVAEAAAKVEALRPRMEEARHAAFRAQEPELLENLADKSGLALDTALSLHELGRQIGEQVAEKFDLTFPESGRYIEFLGKLNKSLALLNAFYLVTGKAAQTNAEEAMREISAAAGLYSSVLAFQSWPIASLYVDMYMLPALKSICASMTRITDLVHADNLTWMEVFGEPLRPDAEIGGMEMWNFMNAAMRAPGPETMPVVKGAVEDVLNNYREELEKGTGTHTGGEHGTYEESEIPTSRTWYLKKKVDTEEARTWVFQHRTDLWILLYGALKPPTRHG